MTTGLIVLIVALLVALGFGLWRLITDGRFRGRVVPRAADPVAASLLEATPYADSLGARATLLQFSSAFCAPCRATRRVLEGVAGTVPGVAHVEVDAESHLELVRRLGIQRTPTTLILDARGRELTRAAGAPSRQAVLASLGESLSA